MNIDSLIERHLDNSDSILLLFQKECGYRFLRIYSKLTTQFSTVLEDVAPYSTEPGTLYRDSLCTNPVDQSLKLSHVISMLCPSTSYPQRTAYTLYMK
jgi:hypothetical protein